MPEVATPAKTCKKRDALEGDSTSKKLAKKRKLLDAEDTETENKQKVKTKLKQKLRPKEVTMEQIIEKPKKKKGVIPDEATKDNLMEKTNGPMKVLKGASKKVKTFDKIKFKPGMKRKHDGDSAEAGDPKKLKLEHMKKKDRKEFRKKQTLKNNYDLIKKTKRMWEELRRHDLDGNKRAKICQELTNMIRGRSREMIFAHDTCRVVQCLMQYGNNQQRNMIFEELKDSIVELTKSTYAKFFIKKIMKYGTKEQKNHVFTAFHGHVRKLIRHTQAAQILEYCYNDYANALQRSMMTEEFYGPTYALFKTEAVRTLDQIIASEPKMKDSILKNMNEALMPLVDKNILMHSLVHRMLHEYLTFGAPQARTEMVELLREQLVPMLHTRDGSRVAMICIWHGTSKDRKAIVKSLKTHIVKLCQEEYGHLVLLAIFDSVDDTKLVQKVVLEELFKSIHDVATNAHGRKVLQYLLKRRDSRHFHPDIIKILQQGDGNTNSKKDSEVRARELLEFASPRLHQYIVSRTHDLVSDNAALLLMLDILTHSTGDASEALKAVAEVVVEPFTDEVVDSHIVATAAGHMFLRKLIAMDKNKAASGRTDLFSVILLDELNPGTLASWISCNRGCFTLVGLLETELVKVKSRIAKELGKIRKKLTIMDSKGAQVLLKKLKF